MGSPVLVSIFDRSDRLVFANTAFRRSYGIDDGSYPTWTEMLRRNFANAHGASIVADDFEKWLASATSRRGKTSFRAFEADLTDGSWLWMTEGLGANGSMLCVAVDITALAASDRHLRHERDLAQRASQTDELTGLANRRFMMALLEAELAKSEPLALAILDIDHFKSINDDFGHLVGDSVLIDFANRARACVRRSDAFGRIGGEEFLLVMPGGDAKQAMEILERIRADLAQTPCVVGDICVSYTFSAGVVSNAALQGGSALLKRADDACYRAKTGGRNRTVSASA
ncbi:diguanylate cyclase (GGDEF) domain-containing protein [Arboricoccus pini]|uniref:diguanylate cyclase n=1 Tax=Arboricoccus pini TaxID=1963835 RepID=A0A212RS52_9PROT|nr:sensor domain-containing diguanylate cyclase [Arboricoccus pini]SNB75419.1 diguanylate cyclase (GGDEF) domain-containing protein [Arboricoccus pini]